MPKVEDVARSALAALDTTAHLELAAEWVNEALAEACAYGPFRFLRRQVTVNWPGPVTAGTVSVAQDSPVVTGNAAAQAEWSPNLIGRAFKASVTWYDITGVDGGPSLRLETPFTESTVSSGSYSIVAQRLVLPGFRRVVQVRVPRLRRQPLQIVSQERLNHIAPSRLFNASGPQFVAAAGELDGELQVELYPYSPRAETLHVLGYIRPPKLGLDDYLPGAIDSTILKDGVLVHAYRYEHARALKVAQGVQTTAPYWQSQLVAQEARWKVSRGLLAMQDRGIDDAMIDVEHSRRDMAYNPDIVSAYDEIYARGRRP